MTVSCTSKPATSSSNKPPTTRGSTAAASPAASSLCSWIPRNHRDCRGERRWCHVDAVFACSDRCVGRGGRIVPSIVPSVCPATHQDFEGAAGGNLGSRLDLFRTTGWLTVRRLWHEPERPLHARCGRAFRLHDLRFGTAKVRVEQSPRGYR